MCVINFAAALPAATEAVYRSPTAAVVASAGHVLAGVVEHDGHVVHALHTCV